MRRYANVWIAGVDREAQAHVGMWAKNLSSKGMTGRRANHEDMNVIVSKIATDTSRTHFREKWVRQHGVRVILGSFFLVHPWKPPTWFAIRLTILSCRQGKGKISVAIALRWLRHSPWSAPVTLAHPWSSMEQV